MTNKFTLRYNLLAASVIAAASVSGCGGGGSDSSDAAQAGKVRVAMTSSHTCAFDSVNVTVNQVRVHASATAEPGASGWVDIPLSPARKINLLALTNGVRDVLGQVAIPKGKYAQLRLVLDPNSGAALANSVKPAGTAEVTLDTPAAIQGGIKLTHDFEVGDALADLVLEVDPCKSVVAKGAGQYALAPMVKAVAATYNGILGNTSTGLSGSKVVVSAQQNGVVLRSTTPVSNAFVLDGLPAGKYDVVVTADGRAAAVITDVPVGADTATTLSNATTPITMPTSTTRNIAGVVTRTPASAGTVVYVAAKQTLPNGAAVTLKSQATDLAAGSYAITNLPVAAPQVAAYSSTLPLVFAASAVLPGAGKYVVEASSAGYATKSLPAVDIATASQTAANFALVP